MNAATIQLALQFFQMAISAAPQVVELVTQAKNYFSAMFTAKLITAEQQNLLHAHIDSISAMAKAGLFPSHWQVEPDPTP